MKKNKTQNQNEVKNSLKKLKGKEGFDEYYQNLFENRWENLKKSFFLESKHVEWKVENCQSYFLDSASVFAAISLPLEGAKNILDLCAAPGGKSLVLASTMPDDAALVCNERSNARKMRLSQVIQNCLSQNIQERIKISCSDGSKWCKTQKECYDRILLDVPCSSERHVIQDEKYLNEWSPNRIKSLAIEQWALLSCAYRLLVPGGYLLYSTCAINKTENDEVVSRLFKKFDDAKIIFDENRSDFTLRNDDYTKFCKTKINFTSEKTEFGYHILPDVQNGAGPIWFTLIHKTNS